MAFQLTKASRYQHVHAKDSEVSGRPLPLRTGDGHLALSVEDRVFLEEALLERSRVISGGDSDDAKWSGSPEGFPVAWHVSGSVALDGGISAVYDSLKGMCGKVIMLSGSYGGTSDAVYGEEYETTGVPDSAFAYLDSESMSGRVSQTLKAVPNSTLEGTLHFDDTTPTGFPGDPVTNAESLTGGTSAAMAALQAAKLFDSLVKTVQDGLSESEGTRSLSVRRYAAAACDAARMDRLLVPATVEDGNCRGTLSVTGVPSISELYPDRRTIWYRGWPTSREYTVMFSTYADCLSTKSSRSFFPFLCWCLCPFWYDTYLWDPIFPSKPHEVNDRHGPMTSGDTYSPTIYFKWKAALQTGLNVGARASSACCPADASVSGMTGSSVLSVSLKSVPEPKSEKAVVVYRAWRSTAQVSGDVSYRSAFAVGVWDVSGGDRVNLPPEATSSSTARSVLSMCGIRTDGMQGFEPEHSRQYGVDVVCAYLVVRPGFRSDISDKGTELRRMASR